MKSPYLLLAALGLGLFGLACDNDGLGQLSVPLDIAAIEDSFQIRVYDSFPITPATAPYFDSGCRPNEQGTFDLEGLNPDNTYSVLFETFGASGCQDRSAIGFRGGIKIAAGEVTYHHVPLFTLGASQALPLDLNLSAAHPINVGGCDETSCGERARCVNDYCIPTCEKNSHCTDFHPRGTCDTETQWCMLKDPYPFNLGGPRALAKTVTLPNGDVVFIGGVRQSDASSSEWVRVSETLERFSAETGLFGPVTLNAVGDSVPKLGLDFGFADLGQGRFVTVGGSPKARIQYERSTQTIQRSYTSEGKARITLWDIPNRRTYQPIEGVVYHGGEIVQSTILPFDDQRFLIIGGVSGFDVGTTPTMRCTFSSEQLVCERLTSLSTPRVNPAAKCLDAMCDTVLVIGGAQVTDAHDDPPPVAELLNLNQGRTQTGIPVDIVGLPDTLYDPLLCGDLLVSASETRGGLDGIPPMRLTRDGEGTWTAEPISELPAPVGASLLQQANDCLIAGGISLDADGKPYTSAALLREGIETDTPLQNPRFGATAALVGAGPLKGSLLFVGGLTLDADSSTISDLRGAEILAPLAD